MLQPAGCLTAADREAREECLRGNPLMAQGYDLKSRLHTLLAAHDPAARDLWLQEAETSGLPPFRPVARRCRQDHAAIGAALTTPCSTGQGEGQSCRVKLIKRWGYGRATLDPRRQRILPRRIPPRQRGGTDAPAQQPAAA